jgi:hypothetical protein
MKVTRAAFVSILISLCSTLLCVQLHASEPAAEKQVLPSDAEQPRYRTPLAGEKYTLTLLGEKYIIPERDRSNTLALMLGGVYYDPPLGDTSASPMAALYWRRESPASWTRLVFSVFVNELDHALKYDHLELLGHLENNTVPFPSLEIEEGREVKGSSINWGKAFAWLGVGYRLPVAPFQTDNDLRLQFFYEGGYVYSSTTKESGRQVSLPPDTYVNGLRLRIRYDGMRRNLFDLLHEGFAAGMDTEWVRRANWSDANYGGKVLSKDETQEFVKLSGYLMAATPVPGLSERNRMVFSFHGGTAYKGMLDRFSLFRIGGGPFANETDDLSRTPYPGAQFNQLPTSDYVVGTVEYRRELLPILYLHLRSTVAWADRDLLSSPQSLELDSGIGKAVSVGLTSGFPWDSEIYLEYSHDDGILRNGAQGDSVLLIWSKAL